jgi:hypothetical protein
MEWFINFVVLALDCSLPIVHALVNALPLLTELDIQQGDIDVFMARELDKKYRWIPPEHIVLDPQCVHLDPERIVWVLTRNTYTSFFRKHLGCMVIAVEFEDGHYVVHIYNNTPGFYPWDRRVALRRAYWKNQIESEVAYFYEI